MNFSVEHGDCYGNGCSGCSYRGYVIDEDAEASYGDYLHDMKEDDGH